MDGAEATRRIRQLPEGKNVKIIGISASAFKEEQQELLDIGMDAFISKPYRLEDIYACLESQLGLKYIYSSTGPMDVNAHQELTSKMFAEVPSALLQELKDAVISMESERINKAIQRIGKIDAVLCISLSHLAKNYSYSLILQKLEEAK